MQLATMWNARFENKVWVWSHFHLRVERGKGSKGNRVEGKKFLLYILDIY